MAAIVLSSLTVLAITLIVFKIILTFTYRLLPDQPIGERGF